MKFIVILFVACVAVSTRAQILPKLPKLPVDLSLLPISTEQLNGLFNILKNNPLTSGSIQQLLDSILDADVLGRCDIQVSTSEMEANCQGLVNAIVSFLIFIFEFYYLTFPI